MSRFPKFNRGVYLENKSKVGSVDEILGPLNAFYFSVKPAEGINPSSFKEGQIFYMAPEDLLSTDRFTKPQAPRPKGPPRQFGAGGAGGRPQQGGRPGGFSGGFNNRGRGAPRGAPRGRGGPSFRGRWWSVVVLQRLNITFSIDIVMNKGIKVMAFAISITSSLCPWIILASLGRSRSPLH